jgi:replicative DNA helicase
MVKRSYSPLKIIPQAEAVKRANKKIYHAMHDKFPGLISRWNKVNRALGGSFRFGEVSYVLGASGSGKSYILNMLREDFAGKLNSEYPKDFKILAFSFEMGAEDEIIRSYSSALKTSYSNLVSANEKITKEYYEVIKQTSEKVDNNKIFYVETTGNREEMLATVNKTAA